MRTFMQDNDIEEPRESDLAGSEPGYRQNNRESGLKAAIVFSQDGIPDETFIPERFIKNDWIQVSFQTLSLNLLLSNLYPSEQPQYCISHGEDDSVVIIRSDNQYIAFLLDKAVFPVIDSFVLDWLQTINVRQLKSMLDC
ncbi:MAG: hypothetical protein AAFR31_05135 [Cyanobacteria bacterium J06627_8]